MNQGGHGGVDSQCPCGRACLVLQPSMRQYRVKLQTGSNELTVHLTNHTVCQYARIWMQMNPPSCANHYQIDKGVSTLLMRCYSTLSVSDYTLNFTLNVIDFSGFGASSPPITKGSRSAPSLPSAAARMLSRRGGKSVPRTLFSSARSTLPS